MSLRGPEENSTKIGSPQGRREAPRGRGWATLPQQAQRVGEVSKARVTLPESQGEVIWELLQVTWVLQNILPERCPSEVFLTLLKPTFPE